MEYQGPSTTFHGLTDLEQRLGCSYMVVKDGKYIAHCGKQATTRLHISYGEDDSEDRFYCAEHEQIERQSWLTPKGSETPSP